MQLLERRVLLSAVEVTSLSLANDTGTPDDQVTSDATLTGTISNDGSVDGQEVDIDVDGNGWADSVVYTDSEGNFTYEGNDTIDYGEVTVQARGSEWDDELSDYVYGEWVALSFTFEPVPVEVTSLSLDNDMGTPDDLVTSDATLTGTISNDGSVDGQEVDIDVDGNGWADSVAYTDSEGNFTYDGNDTIAYGEVTVQVRGSEWDDKLSDYIYGEWVALTFTFEPEPVEVTALSLANDTDTPDDGVTTDATLTGTISNGDDSVDMQEVQIDVDGDGVADDSVYTDSQGNFTYDGNSTIDYGAVTVQARGVEWDDKLDDYLYGEWVALSFTFEAEPVEVTALSLANDTDTPDDSVTTDATLTGTISNGDGSVDMQEVQIDVDGDGVADDSVYTDSQGSFTYDGNLTIDYGSVTVQARGVEWDENLDDYLYGEWVTLSFTFEVVPVEVTSLSLANDTGTPDDGVTTDATLTGTISNDGSLDMQEVQIDVDGDGVGDESVSTDSEGNFTYDGNSTIDYGEVTVQVRGVEWDENLGDYVYGEWVTLSFTHEDPYA